MARSATSIRSTCRAHSSGASGSHRRLRSRRVAPRPGHGAADQHPAGAPARLAELRQVMLELDYPSDTVIAQFARTQVPDQGSHPAVSRCPTRDRPFASTSSLCFGRVSPQTSEHKASSSTVDQPVGEMDVHTGRAAQPSLGAWQGDVDLVGDQVFKSQRAGGARACARTPGAWPPVAAHAMLRWDVWRGGAWERRARSRAARSSESGPIRGCAPVIARPARSLPVAARRAPAPACAVRRSMTARRARRNSLPHGRPWCWRVVPQGRRSGLPAA